MALGERADMRRRAVALTLALVAAAVAAAQDRRVQPIVARRQLALVIGNSAYGNRPLANAANDAQTVARRLRELNFDVTLVTDAGRKAMGQAIDQFTARLGTGDVGFFYYSGHGVQVEGENYLIPTDYQGQSEADVRYDAHPAGRIQERMERSGAKLNILVLDACRDNPYHAGSRGLGGLAEMRAGRGTYIVFATSPGRTASDSGLFARSLVEALSVRGLGLNDVFDMVRERVDATSDGKQLPWTLSSVVGRYSFWPGEAPPATATPLTGPQLVKTVEQQFGARSVSYMFLDNDCGYRDMIVLFDHAISGGGNLMRVDGRDGKQQWLSGRAYSSFGMQGATVIAKAGPYTFELNPDTGRVLSEKVGTPAVRDNLPAALKKVEQQFGTKVLYYVPGNLGSWIAVLDRPFAPQSTTVNLAFFDRDGIFLMIVGRDRVTGLGLDDGIPVYSTADGYLVRLDPDGLREVSRRKAEE
jgi:hypothetical protein